MAARGRGAQVALLLVLLVASTVDAYTLSQNYDGTSSNFFDFFTFWADAKGHHNDDSTNGYVYYTSRQQAQDWGLIWTSPDGAFIKPDTTTESLDPGRAAVRMQTNQTFNHGLFIFDILHMPTGCGTWPALWMSNDPWPDKGEIDIIEGVNLYTDDKSTLHTSAGCNMNNVDMNSFTGYFDQLHDPPYTGTLLKDCYKDAYAYAGQSNLGCGIFANKNNFGANLNSHQPTPGGVWAVEWQSSGIKMWFFWRNQIPSDIQSGNPNPSSWADLPYAHFPFGNDCSSSHFSDLAIIINLTFCGGWGNGDWPYGCQQLHPSTTCADFVKLNPSSFTEAYWQIKSIKVYT